MDTHGLLKKVRCKIFAPGNKSSRMMIVRAGKGKLFQPGADKGVVAEITAIVEKLYPTAEYKVVKVGPCDYNFLYVRERPLRDEELRVGGMQLGDVATVRVGA